MKETAYITGASAGLGAEFARQLANQYHLLLIARDKEKLSRVKTEIENKGGTAEIYICDLSRATDVHELQSRILREARLGLLVNNAGFGTVGPFHATDFAKEQGQILVNINALHALTYAALKVLTAKNSGAIINVSSVAAFQPAPYSATYAATKAFVLSLTRAIAEELSGSDVVMQALCPGLTRTEFHERAEMEINQVPDIAWMSAEDVVKASLEGLKNKELTVVPGIVNKTMMTLGNFIPDNLKNKIVGAAMKSGFGA